MSGVIERDEPKAASCWRHRRVSSTHIASFYGAAVYARAVPPAGSIPVDQERVRWRRVGA